MKSQRQYCQDILERISQIRRFTIEGEDAFMADDRTQEAVIRCFEVIGEVVKRINPDLIATYPSLAWRSYAGFRDVLIHQYDEVLLPKIWQAVQDDLEPLETGIEALLKVLDEQQTD